jgi:hypothetical protein
MFLVIIPVWMQAVVYCWNMNASVPSDEYLELKAGINDASLVRQSGAEQQRLL